MTGVKATFSVAVSLTKSLCLQFQKQSEELGLQNNQLTGTFLTEIEGLHLLKRLDLSHNQIQGELPEVFQRLHSLGETAAC